MDVHTVVGATATPAHLKPQPPSLGPGSFKQHLPSTPLSEAWHKPTQILCEGNLAHFTDEMSDAEVG